MIDADALEELFRCVIGGIAKEPEMTGNLEHMIRASAMVIEMIHDAPTIEQPQVVKCQDCKYLGNPKKCIVQNHAESTNTLWLLSLQKDWYCADGK